MTNNGKINLSKMARIDQDLAELDGKEAELHGEKARLLVERAKILAGMADNDVDIGTGRKRPAPHYPKTPPVSELAMQRAKQALAERRTK